MNIVLDIFVIGIACFAAFLVYAFTEQAVRHMQFGISPRAIAAAVAMLSFLAITGLGRGVALLLLIPYAALGLSLVILYLMALFGIKTNAQSPFSNKHWLQTLHNIALSCGKLIRRALETILKSLPR